MPSDRFSLPYLVQAPMILQPLMLEQLLRARSLRWILVEALLQKRDERRRETLGNRRTVVLDYSEHHY